MTSPWDSLAQQILAAAAVNAAEAYAQGHRCLTVVHGDPESPEDEQALGLLREGLYNLSVLAGGTRDQLVRTVGTNDTTTWWWRSSDQVSADELVTQARRIASACASPWWRIDDNPSS